MLEYLVDDNNIDIERDHLNLIKDLIAGAPRSQRYFVGIRYIYVFAHHFGFCSQFQERRFLFDIVANKRNSVDVDKFDYIERDTHNIGLRSSYDAKRLLMFSRVVNNEICYHHKEVYNIYEMFHTRYSLFKRIYTHRVGKHSSYHMLLACVWPILNWIGKAVELMITDALVHAGKTIG